MNGEQLTLWQEAYRASPLEQWCSPRTDTDPSNLWLLEIACSPTSGDGGASPASWCERTLTSSVFRLRAYPTSSPHPSIPSTHDNSPDTDHDVRLILNGSMPETSGQIITLLRFTQPPRQQESWPTPDARDSQPEGFAAGMRRKEKYSTWGLQTAVVARSGGWSDATSLTDGASSDHIARGQGASSSAVLITKPTTSTSASSTLATTPPAPTRQPSPSSSSSATNSTDSLNHSDIAPTASASPDSSTDSIRSDAAPYLTAISRETDTGTQETDSAAPQPPAAPSLWALLSLPSEPLALSPVSDGCLLLLEPLSKDEMSDSVTGMPSSSLIGTARPLSTATTDGRRSSGWSLLGEVACTTSPLTRTSLTSLKEPLFTIASLSVWPGSRQARQMTVTSGRKLLASLPSCDRELSWLRTLVASSAWRSTMCLLTWKHKTTPAGRSYYQLAVSAPPISGIGFGLWPTPKVAVLSGRAKATATHGWDLPAAVVDSLEEVDSQFRRLLPTPDAGMMQGGRTLPEGTTLTGMTPDGKKRQVGLTNAVKMLPTPRAARAGRECRVYPNSVNHGDLEQEVAKELPAAGMKLNPAWVSRMMGFPDDYLTLDGTDAL